MCQDEIKHTFFSFAAFTHLLFTSKFSKENKRIQNRLYTGKRYENEFF